MGLLSIISTLALAASAIAQSPGMAVWNTNNYSVSYGVAIPKSTAAPFDMLITITTPAKIGWAGMSLGGCMLRSPLLVAWPNGNDVLSSTRWATAYHAPAYYNGSNVTIYSSSTVNETHLVANVLCSGCSTWTGGSLDPAGSNPFGYALSSRNVTTPSSLTTAIGYHDIAKDHFELDLSTAQVSQDDFNSLIKSFGAPISPPASS